MFTEDVTELPEKCIDFTDRLNEYILQQNFTERQIIHLIRDLYRTSHMLRGVGSRAWVYKELAGWLKEHHGYAEAKQIYDYITENL